MADNRNDLGSFDADKELEQLMNNLNMQKPAQGQQSQTTGQPQVQRPAPKRPVAQQRPAAPQPQRPTAPQPQRPTAPQPQRSQQPQPAQSQHWQGQSTQRKQSKTARIPFLGKQPRTRIAKTTKNGIDLYEDKTDYSRMDDTGAEYYSGEVYFAAKKPVQPSKAVRARLNNHAVPKNDFEEILFNISRSIREGGEKAMRIYIAVLIALAIAISCYMLSLIGDVLAYNRNDEVVTVTIAENATTNKIITQLDREGLIKHAWFCKLFIAITNNFRTEDPVYLSGVYYLTPDMGVEKLLLSCREIKTADTVTVTIPEGFTIEQIATKLEKSKVCMSDEFYRNLESATFNYKFISSIDNKDARYRVYEGYLYPNTYEFYVGQNASSVINTLFEEFDKKWTDKYAARAKELGMTVDEVVTLASIVQKEAADGEQMPVVAAVFHNRLNSNGFPSLQSDATNVYVNRYIKPHVNTGQYDTYWAGYSTYACRGLPMGPICSPGDAAIRAVLWPSSTDAYFFCHDKSGNIYTAKTEAEHNANYYATLQ